MASSRPVVLLVAAFLTGSCSSAEQESGCTITANQCRNFPEYQRKQFRDTVGEENVGAGKNDAACLKRAQDFHHWCGNDISSGAQVAATFNSLQLSQVYHPGACEKGWSQFDAFCYKHYWDKRTWFEAERLCRDRDAHLASVHSQAENRFVFTLTQGLSAWIGYTDLDQDTHYKWSDDTQDDFSNFAKNCTGREHEPDCKPEERQQQWYDWEGGDAGTYVCKKNALLPMALLRNVSAADLIQKAWSKLLPALSASAIGDGTDAEKKLGSLPSLKVDDIANVPTTDSATASKPSVPEPKLALPKGTFL
eukprot:TRINITY_DN8616_c1_g1_i1.p1 TRINITY_DN8616_c1_g1~~TRINITY_DN8616_c1_g1_i1.p1  ORF type:complete len:307 (+),score=56.79 TRINITY_DN8616_c1_g1_i1:46-966(+)